MLVISSSFHLPDHPLFPVFMSRLLSPAISLMCVSFPFHHMTPQHDTCSACTRCQRSFIPGDEPSLGCLELQCIQYQRGEFFILMGAPRILYCCFEGRKVVNLATTKFVEPFQWQTQMNYKFKFLSKSMNFFPPCSLQVVLGCSNEQWGGALYPPRLGLYCSVA